MTRTGPAASTASTASTAPTTTTVHIQPGSRWLRWHPARLLYLFVVTLVVGILYSEVQALLVSPASALDPSQLRGTFLWHVALTSPVPFGAACVVALGAAMLGWRLDRRYSALQEEQRHDETVALAEAVVHRAQAAGRLRVELANPRDLPPRAPGFVGRQADLAEITASLQQRQAIAIVGMGGLGKSSLAAEAMHALASAPGAFSGGVTWVRCDERTGLDGAVWIADQLLAAWGASLPAETTTRASTPEEGLVQREHALRKRLSADGGESSHAAKLVLLDNVEPGLPLGRLLDTLEPLDVATLITTRVEPASQRLRLLKLDMLSPDAAMRLFAERFTNRGGVWDATRDAVPAAEIVDALGGLPLAIELAAARAARTRLPLAALAAELRTPDALASLTSPLDPGSGVRYSLRKTLLALIPSQRARFAALGLPEGLDWPLPVILHVFEGAQPSQDSVASAKADLEALVAYSLVSLTSTSGGDQAEVQRVRLHPLVRELAREEFAAQGEDEQNAALAGLLAGLEDWVTQHQQPSVRNYHILARDLDLGAGAIRAAVARHVGLAQVIAIIDMGRANIGDNRVGLELYKLQLQSARSIADRKAELSALSSLALTSGYLGQPEESDAYRREALALARELGDGPAILTVLQLDADRAFYLGASAEAEEAYEEASAILRDMGESARDPGMLARMGIIAFAAGHTQEAERLNLQAIDGFHVAGDRLSEILVQANLAFLYDRQGDADAAKQRFQEVIVGSRELETAHGEDVSLYSVAVALNGLGQIALKAGEIQTAAYDFAEALPLFEGRGALSNVVQVRGNLAVVKGLEARQQGDGQAAVQALEEALNLFEQTRGNANATDMRPFVRQLLASMGQTPDAR